MKHSPANIKSLEAAKYIKSSKDQILQEWEATIRDDFDEISRLDGSTVRDSIPKLLDSLSEALRQRDVSEGVRSRLEQIANEHAHDRAFHTDFTIEHVIREYQILTRVIFDVIERDGLLDRNARATILDAITEGMAKATAKFAETTDAKEANIQERLARSEGLFKTIFDLAAAGKALIDIETGRFLKVNRTLCEMLGYTEQELQTKTWTEITHPEDREKKAKIYGSWFFEKRYVRKDGSVIWVLLSGAPIPRKGGKPAQYISTVFNITEKKAAEEALKKSEERLSLALSAGKIGVWEMDLASPEISWSPRQFEIFGVAPHTKPLTYQVFLNRLHPDDRRIVNKELEMALNQKRDFALEYRIVLPSGSIRWIHANGRIYYDKSGKAQRMIGTNTDITSVKEAEKSLRQSEAQFRALADSMPQIVWTADTNGNFDYFNQRFYNYTDLPFEDAKDLGWTKNIFPQDRPAALRKWKAACASEKKCELEFRLRRIDGEYRWQLCRGIPMRDDRGNLVKWFGTATDIHDYKMLIDALEEERLLRERFTSMLAHDLRNPLGTAKMSTQMALRYIRDPENQERLLLKALDSIDRIDKMITDLLDANRIKAGETLPLKIEFCDLAEVLSQAVDEQIFLHGSRFVLNLNGPVNGFWSPNDMRRVFDNLLSNAVKYGAPDTPIKTTMIQTNGSVRIEVHNIGSELSAAEIKQLYSLFRRSRDTENRTLGWGIGLTLVKGIVEAHGGRTWAESRAGAGTTFFVEVPKDSRQNGNSEEANDSTNQSQS